MPTLDPPFSCRFDALWPTARRTLAEPERAAAYVSTPSVTRGRGLPQKLEDNAKNDAQPRQAEAFGFGGGRGVFTGNAPDIVDSVRQLHAEGHIAERNRLAHIPPSTTWRIARRGEYSAEGLGLRRGAWPPPRSSASTQELGLCSGTRPPAGGTRLAPRSQPAQR